MILAIGLPSFALLIAANDQIFAGAIDWPAAMIFAGLHQWDSMAGQRFQRGVDRVGNLCAGQCQPSTIAIANNCTPSGAAISGNFQGGDATRADCGGDCSGTLIGAQFSPVHLWPLSCQHCERKIMAYHKSVI